MKLKLKILYSYIGIAAGGTVVFLIIALLSFIFGGKMPVPELFPGIYAVIASGFALFFLVSGISLMRHEGIRPKNLTGTFLGFLWVSINLAGIVLKDTFFGNFAVLLVCYADIILSGIFLCAFTAAKHRPDYDKDFVIILGCSISKNGGLLPLLKGRTNRAIRFAWDQERASEKPARFVPTGGQGADEIMSEGSAMEMYLLSHGAEQYEIFPEKRSANTYENMLFSKRIIDGEKNGAKVCFVTTNYHVLRSGMIAKKIGYDAEGLASETKWYFWPNGLAREIFAIIVMEPVLHISAAAVCLAAALICF